METKRIKTFALMTLEGRPPHEILIGAGHGYLEAAVALAEHLGQIPTAEHGGVFTYLPVLFNLHQGLENFLKAVTLWLGQKAENTHDLDRLVVAFNTGVKKHDVLSDEARFNADHITPVAKWDRWAAEQVPNYTCGTAMRYLTDRQRKPVYGGLTISDWDRPEWRDEEADNEMIRRIRTRLSPVLEAIETLDEVIATPTQANSLVPEP